MFGGKKRLVMCQACRGLIAASVKTCPLCGRDSVPPALARSVADAGSTRFFTLLLITINVAVFIMMAAVDQSSNGHESSITGPASYPVLLDFGERSISLIARGQWWRLVTPIFIHLGVFHLLFNNMALFQIGPLIEESLGSQKFILVYLACGIVGNIGSYVFGIQGAGASGAIFGLIGLAAVYGYRIGGTMGRSLMKQMLIWGAIGLVMGQALHFDNVNHVGGLITGAALGFALSLEHPTSARLAFAWNSAAILSVALVAVSFAMVALHYGQSPNRESLLRMSGRVEQMRKALNDSFNWKKGSGQEPAKIASTLRSAADDIRRLPRIDAHGDTLRDRFLDLAERRAKLFDSADKDPDSIAKSTEEDFSQAQALFEDYGNWQNTAAAEAGLR